MLAIALMSINAVTGSGCALFCCICQDNSDLQWSTKALSLGRKFTFSRIMPLQLSPFQRRHLVEHFSNHPLIILYAPTFGIHVKTATTHKDIGLTTSFSTTCEWICFLSSSANRPTICMHWEARKRWTTTCRRCNVEHALSILYAFASSINVNEAVATN
jgi:hypothetical protein